MSRKGTQLKQLPPITIDELKKLGAKYTPGIFFHRGVHSQIALDLQLLTLGKSCIEEPSLHKALWEHLIKLVGRLESVHTQLMPLFVDFFNQKFQAKICLFDHSHRHVVYKTPSNIQNEMRTIIAECMIPMAQFATGHKMHASG